MWQATGHVLLARRSGGLNKQAHLMLLIAGLLSVCVIPCAMLPPVHIMRAVLSFTHASQ